VIYISLNKIISRHNALIDTASIVKTASIYKSVEISRKRRIFLEVLFFSRNTQQSSLSKALYF